MDGITGERRLLITNYRSKKKWGKGGVIISSITLRSPISNPPIVPLALPRSLPLPLPRRPPQFSRFELSSRTPVPERFLERKLGKELRCRSPRGQAGLRCPSNRAQESVSAGGSCQGRRRRFFEMRLRRTLDRSRRPIRLPVALKRGSFRVSRPTEESAVHPLAGAA